VGSNLSTLPQALRNAAPKSKTATPTTRLNLRKM
jgi:hypothetical protein